MGKLLTMRPPTLSRIARGRGAHAVVLIPGMFTESEGSSEHWIPALRAAGFKGAVYDFRWDSSKPEKAMIKIMMATALAVPISPVVLSGPALAAPLRYEWSKLKSRAKRSGQEYLRTAIEVGVNERRVTILAHSLGARVAYYGVAEGGAEFDRLIMVGGAIRSDSSKDWDRMADRVPGGIHNVRNERDKVLRYLFRAAELRQDSVGRMPIMTSHPNIFDIDVTDDMKAEGWNDLENSHTHYYRVLRPTDLF